MFTGSLGSDYRLQPNAVLELGGRPAKATRTMRRGAVSRAMWTSC